jgi:hypothetical protein
VPEGPVGWLLDQPNLVREIPGRVLAFGSSLPFAKYFLRKSRPISSFLFWRKSVELSVGNASYLALDFHIITASTFLSNEDFLFIKTNFFSQ